jgi:hypothetical protein
MSTGVVFAAELSLVAARLAGVVRPIACQPVIAVVALTA